DYGNRVTFGNGTQVLVTPSK
uniref:Uncharacterized protein n=1 Tax=Ovis aries TaxID=9940 RepID=A0AC11DTE3_SHEEP